jgi:hypothetical protein
VNKKTMAEVFIVQRVDEADILRPRSDIPNVLGELRSGDLRQHFQTMRVEAELDGREEALSIRMQCLGAYRA